MEVTYHARQFPPLCATDLQLSHLLVAATSATPTPRSSFPFALPSFLWSILCLRTFPRLSWVDAERLDWRKEGVGEITATLSHPSEVDDGDDEDAIARRAAAASLPFFPSRKPSAPFSSFTQIQNSRNGALQRPERWSINHVRDDELVPYCRQRLASENAVFLPYHVFGFYACEEYPAVLAMYQEVWRSSGCYEKDSPTTVQAHLEGRGSAKSKYCVQKDDVFIVEPKGVSLSSFLKDLESSSSNRNTCTPCTEFAGNVPADATAEVFAAIVVALCGSWRSGLYPRTGDIGSCPLDDLRVTDDGHVYLPLYRHLPTSRKVKKTPFEQVALILRRLMCTKDEEKEDDAAACAWFQDPRYRVEADLLQRLQSYDTTTSSAGNRGTKTDAEMLNALLTDVECHPLFKHTDWNRVRRWQERGPMSLLVGKAKSTSAGRVVEVLDDA